MLLSSNAENQGKTSILADVYFFNIHHFGMWKVDWLLKLDVVAL